MLFSCVALIFCAFSTWLMMISLYWSFERRGCSRWFQVSRLINCLLEVSASFMNFKCLSKNCPLLTPFLPKVCVRLTSGRRQDLSFLCSAPRTQSSQYAFGHFGAHSSQMDFFKI